MRSCSMFSLAVVALAFVSLTGCAHTGTTVRATGLTGENAPITQAMKAAGTEAGTGYAKRVASPIADALLKAPEGMEAAQASGYAKRAQ